MAKYDRLLDLIFEHCTVDQVKEILRPALGNKNVKLSADDKEDLVYSNLRDALNSFSLDVERVYDALREAEENGPQRVFYLRCTSKDVAQLLTLEFQSHIPDSDLFGGLATEKAAKDLLDNNSTYHCV